MNFFDNITANMRQTAQKMVNTDNDGNLRPNDAPDVKVSFKSAGPAPQQGG